MGACCSCLFPIYAAGLLYCISVLAFCIEQVVYPASNHMLVRSLAMHACTKLLYAESIKHPLAPSLRLKGKVVRELRTTIKSELDYLGTGFVWLGLPGIQQPDRLPALIEEKV